MTLKLHNSIPKDPYTKQLWSDMPSTIGLDSEIVPSN